MTTKYFVPQPKTCEELKSQYRNLAFDYHPDRGGDTNKMQLINNEYSDLFRSLKDIHLNVKGEIYSANQSTTEIPEDFVNIINILIRFENVIIEIIGRFIWVTGNTRPYKDILKQNSFKWHSNKKAWYLPYEGYVKRNKLNYTMNDIRNMFETQEIQTVQTTKIA